MDKDILSMALGQSGLDSLEQNASTHQPTSSTFNQQKKLNIEQFVVNGQVYYKTVNGVVQIKPNNVIQLVSQQELNFQMQAEQGRRLLEMHNILNNNNSIASLANQLNNPILNNQIALGSQAFAKNKQSSSSFLFGNLITRLDEPQISYLGQQASNDQKPENDLLAKATRSLNQTSRKTNVETFTEIFKEVNANEEIDEEDESNFQGETYADYIPSKLKIGKKHPDLVVETSSLSSVLPPDPIYKLSIPEEAIDEGKLSALQLESITYACQQHQTFLNDCKTRSGFLIGDGAGVGKGRTIAGIIYENYIVGRKKAIWISASADLKYDSKRDLDDIGATNIDVHALNKLKYAKINSKENGKIKKGVIFSTYSSLISKSTTVKGKNGSRLDQLVEWCGKDFEGVIVFDECHKAKNLLATSGKRGGKTKPTKTAEAVVKLQEMLPNARIVYASATGATEVKNMAYMVRLGLWGLGTPFKDFDSFMSTVDKRGVGALELVAIDMKQRGLYIARQLSFKGVTFEIKEIDLDEEFIDVYNQSVELWQDAKDKLELALGLMVEDAQTKKQIKSQFWSAHQRFFKYLCIAAKVPHIVNVAKEELRNGNAIVIGLQSTGEARTLEALEENNGELTDFVSTAKAVFVSFLDKFFPAPNEQKGLKLLGLNKNYLKDKDYNDRSSRTARAQANNNLKKYSTKSKAKSFINDDDSEATEESSSSSESESESEENNSDDDFIVSDKESEDEENQVKNDEGSSTEVDDDSDAYSSENSNLSTEDDSDEFDDSDEEPWEKYGQANKQGKKRSKNKETGKKKNKRPDFGSKEAGSRCIKLKNSLLDKLDKFADRLPPNTIDDLIEKLGGTDCVAELTGRKGRVVSHEGDVVYESRREQDISLEKMNIVEKERFMNGEKNIAIISEAASSGISLQSDRRAKNQKRRVHLTIELPWSADRAIQQFGRTHRSNQVNAPKYIFMISELCGEQRFASTVAKRLQSLGALTHGDRRAGDSRDLSKFNFESKFSKDALRTVMDVILGYGTSPIEVSGSYDKTRFFDDCRTGMAKVGLIEHDKSMRSYYAQDDSKIDIDRFLNRILGMKVDLQNTLFKYFSDTMDAYIRHAKRLGRFDRGIKELRSDLGQVQRKKSKTYLNKYGNMQTTIELHELSVNRGLTWEKALEMIEGTDDSDEGFYKSRPNHLVRTGIVLAIRDSSNQAYRGIFRIYKPNIGLDTQIKSLSDLKYTHKKIDKEEAEVIWNNIYDTSANLCSHLLWYNNCKKSKNKKDKCDTGLRKQDVHILSGSIFALWSTIEKVLSGSSKLQIIRISDVDIRIIGIEIPEWAVSQLEKALDEADQQCRTGVVVKSDQIEALIPDSDSTIDSF